MNIQEQDGEDISLTPSNVKIVVSGGQSDGHGGGVQVSKENVPKERQFPPQRRNKTQRGAEEDQDSLNVNLSVKRIEPELNDL